MKSPIRPAIEHLAPNPLGRVARIGGTDPDMIPLWFGESDLVTPDFIRQAAKDALDRGDTFYAAAGGTLALRQGIVDWTRRWYGVELPLERVWVPGAAMLCVVTAVLSCAEAGDEVIVVSPMWPNISQAIVSLGATPRYVRLTHDRTAAKWRLDMDQLAAAVGPKTKAIFIGSPSNPTGWTATPQEQRVLLAFARERGLAIISDEVYGVLAFGMKRAPSFLDIAEDEDNVFVINSFSKAWAMTGWRIGWLVAPKRLSGAMAQLGVNLNTGTTVFAQAGAVAALKDGDGFIAEMQARCLKGREIVGEFIAAQNRLSWVKPDGAFYAYVEVDGLTDSVAFASTLLQTAKVGVAPGAAFASGPGDTRDESYLRLCFAPSPARLTAALERIAAALR